jgi:hypothetical protein
MSEFFRWLILLFGLNAAAMAEVSYGVSIAGSHIGISLSSAPQLAPIPGYPVYYAPGMSANFFFYQNRYWVFHGDTWYQSGGYRGPWIAIRPAAVPAFLLRVPVRYYRRPPAYFRGWRSDAPPRWEDHWGRNRDRRAQPLREPLPVRRPTEPVAPVRPRPQRQPDNPYTRPIRHEPDRQRIEERQHRRPASTETIENRARLRHQPPMNINGATAQ